MAICSWRKPCSRRRGARGTSRHRSSRRSSSLARPPPRSRPFARARRGPRRATRRPAPTRAKPLTKTPAYAGNTTPGGKPYHVGAGISALELDTLGHSFYESGGLCLSLGTAQVEQLSSGLLSALIPSLSDLTRGQNSSVQLVIRPQNPPTFALGKGTFKVDGMGQKTIDDPLLSLQIKDLALDFYVYMDERMVRFMRQTADINVPLALDIDNMSQIVPILGDLSNAFGNVRVTDSSLLKEPPAQLAALFPSLLPALLGSISSSIKPIKLPDLLGLKLVPVEFTSTPDAQGQLAFLGLFLSLQQGMAPMPVMANPEGPVAASPPSEPSFVETQADLVQLDVPPAALLRRARRRCAPRCSWTPRARAAAASSGSIASMAVCGGRSMTSGSSLSLIPVCGWPATTSSRCGPALLALPRRWIRRQRA